jgi:hypothetical protein
VLDETISSQAKYLLLDSAFLPGFFSSAVHEEDFEHLIRFLLQQDHCRQEINMEKIATSMNVAGHILSHREMEFPPQWVPSGETVKDITYELAEFVRFRMQGNWLTTEDMEALRQLLLVYPEGEELHYRNCTKKPPWRKLSGAFTRKPRY